MSTHKQAELKTLHFPNPGEIPHLFAEAWNNRDAASIAGLFRENAEFVNVVGLWWHNRHDIYKAHDYGLRTIFPDSDLKVGRVKVTELNENAAVVHARMTLDGQSSHGSVNQPDKRQNIFSFVVTKTDQGWICVSAHNTDVVPGKETNIVDEEGNISSADYRQKSGASPHSSPLPAGDRLNTFQGDDCV